MNFLLLTEKITVVVVVVVVFEAQLSTALSDLHDVLLRKDIGRSSV